MLLRRKTASKVRFIQEIGRSCRAHPGKVVAIILDPRRMFDKFGLEGDAAVGWIEDEDEAEKVYSQGEEDDEDEDEEEEPFGRPDILVGISDVEEWIGRLARAIRNDGFATEGSTRMERSAAAAMAQIRYLASLRRHTVYADIEHRAALDVVLERPDVLTAGAASDLIGLLLGLHNRYARVPGAREWLPSYPIAPVAPDDVRRIQAATPKAAIKATTKPIRNTTTNEPPPIDDGEWTATMEMFR